MVKNICEKCKKPIVHPDDWGDYDNACEWACTCTEHFPYEPDEYDTTPTKTCKCGIPYRTKDIMCPECRELINFGKKPHFDTN